MPHTLAEPGGSHLAWTIVLVIVILVAFIVCIRAELATLVVFLGPLFNANYSPADVSLGNHVAWAVVGLSLLVGLLHAAHAGYLPTGHSGGLPQARPAARESGEPTGGAKKPVGHGYVASWLHLATVSVVLMDLAFAAERALALLQIENNPLVAALAVVFFVCLACALFAISFGAGHIMLSGLLALLLIIIWFSGLPLALLFLPGAIAAHLGATTKAWFIQADDEEHGDHGEEHGLRGEVHGDRLPQPDVAIAHIGFRTAGSQSRQTLAEVTPASLAWIIHHQFAPEARTDDE